MTRGLTHCSRNPPTVGYTLRVLAAALVAVLGVLLIARRSSWARDVAQLQWLGQRTRERVIVMLGLGLLAVAVTLAVEALTS